GLSILSVFVCMYACVIRMCVSKTRQKPWEHTTPYGSLARLLEGHRGLLLYVWLLLCIFKGL
ncbi:MAG: hypothetical protein ACJ702_04100, partial [Nitrososphaeraceae archaeon]